MNFLYTKLMIAGLLLAAAWLPVALKAADTDAPADRPVAVMTATEVCTKIGNKLASVNVVECNRQNLMPSAGVSVRGLPILIKTYPPPQQHEPLGKVLLIGGIHGDEYASVSVIFKWMNILNEHYSGMFHWHIVPLVNPDGLLQGESQRTNANGVDLNRNFPMREDWLVALEDYWSSATDRNTRFYPGSGPLSEPETHWLAAEIERFQPDVVVLVHAPYGVGDYDNPPENPHQLGHLYLEPLGTYPGSLSRYVGIQLGIPLVTIELPYADIMPSSPKINEIWMDLVHLLRGNMPVDSSALTAEQKNEKS